MFDLYSNGFWTVVHSNWIWLALAVVIGAVIGWRTCEHVPGNGN